ncbi:MAG: methylglyoxal reductase (NADPH-dependent) gre2 [Bogoriella megaspora]|nr:MAG: methylglyoxal reductase (NADPH-dependent) gre2 [Bogoriella megaspora]
MNLTISVAPTSSLNSLTAVYLSALSSVLNFKANDVSSDFPSHAKTSSLDFAIVPDITASQALNEALKSTSRPFDIVIHTASHFLYRAVNSNPEFLEPAFQGTTRALESDKAVAPSVKRVIIASSFAAVVDLANVPGMAGKVHTEKDWNPIV